MKALQLHYTSCRRGLSGSAGFQTRTLTPGIRPEEQREIERRGIYRPPRDAAPEPGPDEIARDFPVALRFYKLESGRLALTRSGYAGRDYSGRWGNFFAHTLVLPDGWQSSSWPIDFFEWPHWWRGLTPPEDTEDEPPKLSNVELTEMDSESFRLEEISQFLREEPARVEALARMGRALFLGRESSRALVLRDAPLNNVYWIAALQKLFPPRHAAQLSYSSYQEDPRDCADVNATCGETGFSFSEAERTFQFYMFDLTAGVASEVPDADDDYPALAARWLAKRPVEMERFFAFMDFFDHQRPDPDLASAFHLFELSRDLSPSLEGDRLTAMIRFAARHATSEGRRQLLAVVADGLQRLGGLRRPEDYGDVVRFLADGARATGQAEDRTLAFETWLQLVDGHVCRPHENGAGATAVAEESWRLLGSILPGSRRELASHFLAPRRWQAWEMPSLSVEVLRFLLRRSWECLALTERHPAWEQPEVITLVGELMRRPGDPVARAHDVLETVPADAAALVASSRLAARPPADDEPRRRRIDVGQALGRVLVRSPAPLAEAVRRQFDDVTEDWDLLYGEWLAIRDRAPDPVAAFRDYRRAVLTALPRYDRSGLAWTASSLLDHLDPNRATRLAVEWLRDGDVDRFSKELAARCLQLANVVLSLDPDDHEADETARLLDAAASRLGVELRPDRPLLRRTVVEALRAARLDASDLAAVGEAFEGIAAADYEELLASFLQPVFALVESRKDHERLVEATFQATHIAIFRKDYLRCLRERPRKKWFQPLLATLKFWLTLDRRKKLGKELSALEEPVLQELTRVLGRLPAKDYKKVQGNLQNLEGRSAERWKRLQEDVRNLRSGSLAKLRRWMPRILGFVGQSRSTKG